MIKSNFTIFLLVIIAVSLIESCNKEPQNNKKSEKALQAIYDPPFYFSCFSFMSIADEVVGTLGEGTFGKVVCAKTQVAWVSEETLAKTTAG